MVSKGPDYGREGLFRYCVVKEPAGFSATDKIATMQYVAQMLLASPVTDRTARSEALSFALGALRPSLLVLMGLGGLRALVARAVVLTSRRFPALRDVTVSADGFVGLDEAGDSLNNSDLDEARVLLLTEVLLLLLQFLGPGMTLGVIRDTWPDAVLDDVDFSQMRDL